MKKKVNAPGALPEAGAAVGAAPMAPTAESLETLAGLGATPEEAQHVLGMTEAQFAALLKDKALAAGWLGGRARADAAVARALYVNATAGNVQAQLAWLAARQPDRWGKAARKASKPAAAPAVTPPAKNPLGNLKLRKA